MADQDRPQRPEEYEYDRDDATGGSVPLPDTDVDTQSAGDAAGTRGVSRVGGESSAGVAGIDLVPGGSVPFPKIVGEGGEPSDLPHGVPGWGGEGLENTPDTQAR